MYCKSYTITWCVNDYVYVLKSTWYIFAYMYCRFIFLVHCSGCLRKLLCEYTQWVYSINSSVLNLRLRDWNEFESSTFKVIDNSHWLITTAIVILNYFSLLSTGSDKDEWVKNSNTTHQEWHISWCQYTTNPHCHIPSWKYTTYQHCHILLLHYSPDPHCHVCPAIAPSIHAAADRHWTAQPIHKATFSHVTNIHDIWTNCMKAQ